MADQNRTIERDEKGRFTYGRPGGPGRPRTSSEIPVQPLTRKEWTEKFDRFFRMKKSELRAFIADEENNSVSDIMIASLVMKQISTGDPHRLDFCLDRTIGKVKEVVQIEAPRPYIIRKRDGSSEELGAANTPEVTERSNWKQQSINREERQREFNTSGPDSDPVKRVWRSASSTAESKNSD